MNSTFSDKDSSNGLHTLENEPVIITTKLIRSYRKNRSKTRTISTLNNKRLIELSQFYPHLRLNSVEQLKIALKYEQLGLVEINKRIQQAPQVGQQHNKNLRDQTYHEASLSKQALHLLYLTPKRFKLGTEWALKTIILSTISELYLATNQDQTSVIKQLKLDDKSIQFSLEIYSQSKTISRSHLRRSLNNETRQLYLNLKERIAGLHLEKSIHSKTTKSRRKLRSTFSQAEKYLLIIPLPNVVYLPHVPHIPLIFKYKDIISSGTQSNSRMIPSEHVCIKKNASINDERADAFWASQLARQNSRELNDHVIREQFPQHSPHKKTDNINKKKYLNSIKCRKEIFKELNIYVSSYQSIQGLLKQAHHLGYVRVNNLEKGQDYILLKANKIIRFFWDQNLISEASYILNLIRLAHIPGSIINMNKISPVLTTPRSYCGKLKGVIFYIEPSSKSYSTHDINLIIDPLSKAIFNACLPAYDLLYGGLLINIEEAQPFKNSRFPEKEQQSLDLLWSTIEQKFHSIINADQANLSSKFIIQNYWTHRMIKLPLSHQHSEFVPWCLNKTLETALTIDKQLSAHHILFGKNCSKADIWLSLYPVSWHLWDMVMNTLTHQVIHQLEQTRTQQTGLNDRDFCNVLNNLGCTSHPRQADLLNEYLPLVCSHDERLNQLSMRSIFAQSVQGMSARECFIFLNQLNDLCRVTIDSHTMNQVAVKSDLNSSDIQQTARPLNPHRMKPSQIDSQFGYRLPTTSELEAVLHIHKRRFTRQKLFTSSQTPWSDGLFLVCDTSYPSSNDDQSKPNNHHSKISAKVFDLRRGQVHNIDYDQRMLPQTSKQNSWQQRPNRFKILLVRDDEEAA